MDKEEVKMTKRQHLSDIKLCKGLIKDAEPLLLKIKKLETQTQQYWLSEELGIFISGLKKHICGEEIELEVDHKDKYV